MDAVGLADEQEVHQFCEDTGCSLEDLPEAMDHRDGWCVCVYVCMCVRERERERINKIRAISVIWWWWWPLICTLEYGFKYSPLIPIIWMVQVFFSARLDDDYFDDYIYIYIYSAIRMKLKPGYIVIINLSRRKISLYSPSHLMTVHV